MEFATFFSELGSKVTVVEVSPLVLGMLDDDVRELLLKKYKEKGIKFVTDVKIIICQQYT